MTLETAAIVTAWNEAERLPETLGALRRAMPAARLLVADDASADGTAHVALQAGAEVVRTPERLGKGGAATLAAARLRGEPVVLLADGDLGASAAELSSLVEVVARGEADVAVAAFARKVGGGFGLAKGAAGKVICRLTGLRLDAPISGQRALSAAALDAVLPFAPGFGMETAMTIDAHRAGLSVVEVELNLEHRATGRTAGGFSHRARQLRDILRVYFSRR